MENHWLDRREYPFTSNYHKVNNHQLHYIDEGKGETMVFVHGTPSWSFDYRNVIAELRKEYRCVAIDHIGFGLSDKPEHYDYSTINHSNTFENFVVHKGLRDITLVMHDFGGPIGFRFAVRHPHLVKRIVVLNSWLWNSENEVGFKSMKRILKSPLLPFLYKYFNFSPRFVMPASFGDHKMPGHIARQYRLPFANSTQRNGPLAFAHSLLNDQEWFQELWDTRQVLMQKQILLIWGMKDPVLKPAYLEKFVSGFPHAKVLTLSSCGHFPQEEQPVQVADGIRKLMAGTF